MEITADGTDGITSVNSSRSVPHEDVRNPMLLSPIITRVYQYLGLKDIKNCRRVSREWNLSSKLVLRKRSKIVLTNEDSYHRSFSIAKFSEDFSESANIPFNAFKLTNYGPRTLKLESMWNVSELNEFFDRQQENLKELELEGIILKDDRQNVVGKYDITPWILKSLLVQPNTKYNTKLSVACKLPNNQSTTSLAVSLFALVSIKNISLTNAVINVANFDGTKISPVNLKLDGIKFSSGEFKFGAFRINDVVDFTKCKSIYLNSGSTKIALDLSRNDKPEYLDTLTVCKDVTVMNLPNSTWKVKELKLYNVPFLNTTGMQITKLELWSSEIDLSCLPHSIEILTLKHVFSEVVICTHPISLPRLKCLCIEIFQTTGCSILSHFKNCPKLVDIVINGVLVFGRVAIKFDCIPQTVRRLKLVGKDFIWQDVGQGMLVIDQLVMSDFTYDHVKRMCIDNIQVNDIILVASDKRFDVDKDLLSLLKYFYESCSPYRQDTRIFVGPVTWAKEFTLYNFVDEIAEYYVFENQRGRVIDDKQFKKLADDTFGS